MAAAAGFCESIGGAMTTPSPERDYLRAIWQDAATGAAAQGGGGTAEQGEAEQYQLSDHAGSDGGTAPTPPTWIMAR